jgi:hypothetical protein
MMRAGVFSSRHKDRIFIEAARVNLKASTLIKQVTHFDQCAQAASIKQSKGLVIDPATKPTACIQSSNGLWPDQ